VPKRFSNDTLIVAGALAFGLISLAFPFVVLTFAPDSELARRGRSKSQSASTLVRNPRSADLKGERLAFTGNCSVGEFKDKRDIQSTIERQLLTYRLVDVTVTVTDMCIAELHGAVRNPRERNAAIRAAGHPWIRAIDIGDLKVVDSEPQPAP